MSDEKLIDLMDLNVSAEAGLGSRELLGLIESADHIK